MNSIAVPIPSLSGEHDIEVEVKVNGVKKQYNYRVEIFYWEDCRFPQENRAECIKQIINDYDANWELAHIGHPTDEYIPITFKKSRS